MFEIADKLDIQSDQHFAQKIKQDKKRYCMCSNYRVNLSKSLHRDPFSLRVCWCCETVTCKRCMCGVREAETDGRPEATERPVCTQDFAYGAVVALINTEHNALHVAKEKDAASRAHILRHTYCALCFKKGVARCACLNCPTDFYGQLCVGHTATCPRCEQSLCHMRLGRHHCCMAHQAM